MCFDILEDQSLECSDKRRERKVARVDCSDASFNVLLNGVERGGVRRLFVVVVVVRNEYTLYV